MLIRSSVPGTYVAGICSLRTFLFGAGFLFTIACSIQAGEAPVVESVWGCLLYASNDRAAEKAVTQIPARIRDYDERLEKLLGYASIQTLGQGETVVAPDSPSSIVFHGNIRVELTGLTRQPGEHFRRPGRFAQQREEFRRLVRRLKRLRSSYSLRELASELGVTSVTVTQWLRGHTPMARPEHVERLKKFLSANRSG